MGGIGYGSEGHHSQKWYDEVSKANWDIEVEVQNIAKKLRRRWPVVEIDGMASGIPFEHAEQLGMVLTDMVAEILQAWLDAGSEREVTQEEVGPVLVEHVWGWSSDPRLGPGSELTFDQAREQFRKEVNGE